MTVGNPSFWLIAFPVHIDSICAKSMPFMCILNIFCTFAHSNIHTRHTVLYSSSMLVVILNKRDADALNV